MRLKYTVISSRKQYDEYSAILKKLIAGGVKTKSTKEEIELLRVLIGKWEGRSDSPQRNSFPEPVALVRSLMAEHDLRAKDLVEILGVSKGLVSDILNYKKGLSKENIEVLARHFNVEITVRYSYKANTSKG
ncbi:MAG TPA: helix-turn-helix domain-containing protein [Cyclobacteriaceae bacterium]|nr:helix-turn-helix domain-containing protein [Cyclobacteriaceae bacterium]